MEKVKKNVLLKVVVEICRILLGVTFIFSGFVKSVDPFGTAYKIEDYLAAFGLSTFSSMPMLIAFVLCALEFMLGIFILLGLYRKWTSRLLLLVMCFMTPLTLYLAIADPVSDCGCFGDALIISNWETFFKNIVLLICAVVVFIYHERISNIFTGKTYWLAFLWIILFTSAFIVRNYYYDPIIDFRPYHIGANIPEQMNVEEGKGRIDESILVYAKDGVEKEFTQDDFPWDDESWTFVRMDTKTIRAGEEPKVKDFSINKLTFSEDLKSVIGEDDITEQVLSDTNYVFLMISPSLANMDQSHVSKFEDVMNYAKEYHYSFYCLTASVTDDIVAWENDNAVDLNFCRIDERTLKTIIRTNPGLLLLKNGIVINKWADSQTPSEEDLTQTLDNLSYSKMIVKKEEDKTNLLYISIIFLLPLLVLKGLDILLFQKKEEKTK